MSLAITDFYIMLSAIIQPDGDVMSDKAQPKTIAQCLAGLESIAKQLENNTLDVEEAIELYGQGVNLGEECQQKLSKAQNKIKILSEKASKIVTCEELSEQIDG